MTRTPDEIKKGLWHCINGTSCRGCPYCEECAIASDCNPMHKDLQDYIQQLEAERDAAIKDMTKIVQKYGEAYCEYCLHSRDLTCSTGFPVCTTKNEGFRWRGVQKEECK